MVSESNGTAGNYSAKVYELHWRRTKKHIDNIIESGETAYLHIIVVSNWADHFESYLSDQNNICVKK